VRPILSNVPVWLCRWKRRRREVRYIPAKSSATARDLCELAGLGSPDSITYAGYCAEPDELRRPKNYRRKIASSRRAEQALGLYALLRVDWPIGSILADRELGNRYASTPALRDFVANVGATLERVNSAGRVVCAVVEAQGRAWWYAAQAKNARRAGDHNLARRWSDRAEDCRHRARRLRKRRAYQLAVGALESELTGETPVADLVADRFVDHLVEHGFSPSDAVAIAELGRRVWVPRL
jgi:hypothetical protein